MIYAEDYLINKEVYPSETRIEIKYYWKKYNRIHNDGVDIDEDNNHVWKF